MGEFVTIRAKCDEMPKLENATAMQDPLKQLVGDVYAGTIHPPVATGLAPLLSLQLRALETAAIEQATRRLAGLGSACTPPVLILENEDDNATGDSSISGAPYRNDVENYFSP